MKKKKKKSRKTEQMSFDYIRLDRLESHKGEIAMVVLNRPQKNNIMDWNFFAEMGRMFREVIFNFILFCFLSIYFISLCFMLFFIYFYFLIFYF
jgi:hypothetical protein